MCFAPGLVKNTLGPSRIRTRDLSDYKSDALPTELLDCHILYVYQTAILEPLWSHFMKIAHKVAKTEYFFNI